MRRPPELAVRVGFNGLAQLAPVIVVLALTPLLLDRLGLDRFGIWSLTLVALNTLRMLDGGVAASLARFFAIHAAHEIVSRPVACWWARWRSSCCSAGC